MDSEAALTNEIELVPLNLHNWESVLQLKLRPEQGEFMPDVLHSLAQSRFDGAEPYGLRYNGQVVGFVMLAKWSGVHWITRFMIDAPNQGKGLGKKALGAILTQISSLKSGHEVRTTVALKNGMAEYLFYNAGFRRSMELENREVVLRLDLDEYRRGVRFS
jgi:diamine N-acetyltransferase